jgi:hypothetical protein
LNPHGAPHFEAIANTGQCVFPTLKALAARVLDTIHTGAKTGSTQAAPAATSQTGFHPAPGAAAHAPPGIQPAARPLQQTGYVTAAQAQGVRSAAQAPAGALAMQKPAGSMPSAQPGGAGGGGLRLAPSAQSNAHEMAQANGSAPAMTSAQAGQNAAGGNLHIMRNEQAAPSAAAAPQKRATPAPRQAPRAEPAGRAQPRAQALPTPVPGSRKKSALYTALFVIVALGVGAVVARLVMSAF